MTVLQYHCCRRKQTYKSLCDACSPPGALTSTMAPNSSIHWEIYLWGYISFCQANPQSPQLKENYFPCVMLSWHKNLQNSLKDALQICADCSYLLKKVMKTEWKMKTVPKIYAAEKTDHINCRELPCAERRAHVIKPFRYMSETWNKHT